MKIASDPWRTLRHFSRRWSVVGNYFLSFLLCQMATARISVLKVFCLFKVGGLWVGSDSLFFCRGRSFLSDNWGEPSTEL